VLSLSHVALPFAPGDPLYGRYPRAEEDVLFLGEMSLRGERGLIAVPADWLLRMRYNPFHAFLEQRVLAWLGLRRDDTQRCRTHGPPLGRSRPLPQADGPSACREESLWKTSRF
jgi:hypothetical protein